MPFDKVQEIYDNIMLDPLFQNSGLDEVTIKTSIVRNSNQLNPNCYNYLGLVELKSKHDLAIGMIKDSIANETPLNPLLDDVVTKDKVKRFEDGDVMGWYFENSVKNADDGYLYKTDYGNEFDRELKKCSRSIVGVVQISPLC